MCSPPGLPIWLQIKTIIFDGWLMFYCIYIFSVHPPDKSVVSISWLLQTVLWQTWEYRCLFNKFHVNWIDLEVGIAGSYGIPISRSLWDLHTGFHKWLYSFKFHQECAKIPFLHILANSFDSNNSRSYWSEIISSYSTCIFLIISNVGHFVIYLLAIFL